MSGDPMVPFSRRARGGGAKRGFSLVELLVAVVIMSVLVSMGIPHFMQSLEKGRADVAGANLRSIWSAQRLYWLQNRTYAPDLLTLQTANLIDPSLVPPPPPPPPPTYTYGMTVASDGSSFTATATHAGTSSWSGSFTIDVNGNFSGSIQQSGQGPTITPDFQ